MSDDIRTGRKARKILTVMAAVFAVAMMLAVPLVVAVDSEAEFVKDEQGYCVNYTNPTPAQMPATVKTEVIMEALLSDLIIFNTGIFEDIAVSDDPITIKIARGEKIESDTTKLISEFEIYADKITITITATEDGDLIDPTIDTMPKVFKDAAEAIKSVMKNEVTTGDVVKITGSLNVKMAAEEDTKYNFLNDNFCVKGKVTTTAYFVNNYDLTVSFKHGSDEEKSVKLFSDLKGMYADEETYEYETTPIEIGTKYTIKDTVSSFNVKGDTHYTVKDKEYTIISSPEPDPEVHDVVKVGDLVTESSINTDEIKTEIAGLPDPADNVTVDKTYGGAQSAFDGVVMDAVGKDILKIVLIVGAVILGIIVLIVILIIVLIVRKKKRQ